MERPRPETLPLATVCGWTLFLGSIALIALTMVRVLPVLTVREALLAGRGAVIAAGPRDGSFFPEGGAQGGYRQRHIEKSG